MSDIVNDFIDKKAENDVKAALLLVYKSYKKQKNVIKMQREKIEELQKDNLGSKEEELRNRIKELEHKLAIIEDFSVSEVERLEINKWIEQHIKDSHEGDDYVGAIGGRFSYEFTPTSLGVIGEVKCTCGKVYCFREIK